MRESETGIEYSTSVTLIDESEHLAGAYIFFWSFPTPSHVSRNPFFQVPVVPRNPFFSKFLLFPEIFFIGSSIFTKITLSNISGKLHVWIITSY